MRPRFLLPLTALALLGCDSSTEPDSSRGNAPVITRFDFSPESTAYYPWGDSITIRGTIGFTDPEGDLASIRLSIAPGGELTLDAGAAAGLVAGTVVGDIRVATGTIGSYTVTVTLLDSQGNRSNPASKVFKVAVDRSGATWGYRISGTTAGLCGVAAGDSTIVAVGSDGTILSSRDGRVWESRASGTSNHLLAVTWTGQEFIAVGEFCTIVASPDGGTWTPRHARRDAGTLNGITAGGGLIVAVGACPRNPGATMDSTLLLTSTDGIAWTERGPGLQDRSLQSVAWSGSRFVAVAMQEAFPADVLVMISPDGLAWSADTLPGVDYSIFDIVWTGQSFVTVGTGGVSFVSNTGTTWQRYTLDAGNQFGVAASGGMLVTVGWNTLTSDDGRSWNRTATQFPEKFQDVIWHDFQYIAVGEQGKIIVSPPGGA
jgi:hypothetical protein